MIQYFPKPYKRCSGAVKVKLDLSNYAIKQEKGKTGVDNLI